MKFTMLTAMATAISLTLSSMVQAKTQEPASAKVASTPVQAPVAKRPDTRSANKAQNLTGIWEIYPDPFAGDENTFVELEPPEGGPKLREPYASQWKARRAERNAKLKAGTPLADPSTLCLPEGMPSVMGAIFPLQILQAPGQIVVLAEFLAQTRRILFNKKMPPVEEVTPSHFGYSIGRWEGKTLVVTTLGVREDTQFFEIPHSAEMKITERIRPTKPGYLESQIVIEDPKVLLEPYRFTFGYKRNDDYEITEYLCEKEDPLFRVMPDGTVQMKAGKDADDQSKDNADDKAERKAPKKPH
jgi:hypothetical protein